MRKLLLLYIVVSFSMLIPFSLQAQEYPRHWLIGMGTNVGNYKLLSPWGQQQADVIDNPTAGVNFKINHFWGVNEKFFLGTGTDFIMMHHRFKPSYSLLGQDLFSEHKIHTAQFGIEIPLYFKWQIEREHNPYDYAISVGHKFSSFYGNPSSHEVNTKSSYRFRFEQSYQAKEEFKYGLNYALFAEFFLIKKREGRDVALSLNYTHYFEHAAFGEYSFFDENNQMLAVGQIQGYCNYVILNFCYKIDKVKEDLTKNLKKQ